MTIAVKYFARYREALGCDHEEVEGDFATIEALRSCLVQRGGYQVLTEANLMCARN